MACSSICTMLGCARIANVWDYELANVPKCSLLIQQQGSSETQAPCFIGILLLEMESSRGEGREGKIFIPLQLQVIQPTCCSEGKVAEWLEELGGGHRMHLQTSQLALLPR